MCDIQSVYYDAHVRRTCMGVASLLLWLRPVFTALHCMQRGLSDERLSICPSVCLSVKRVNCDKTKAPIEKVQL